MYILSSLRSSRRELNFSVMRYGLYVHKGAMTKKFRSIQSISVCWVATYVYIELPVGSSSRELQEGAAFFAMGFGFLIHSGAMTKFPEV